MTETSSGGLVLVTGGSGFIGSALVRRLAGEGRRVRVLDDGSRGRQDRLAGLEVERVSGDVRDETLVREAMSGVETVFHLAYVNGTEHFYSKPDVVLDIAVRGQLNALDAAREAGVETFVYASSSETYQTPPVVPTPEQVPLVVPDVRNPRYSYGGGKIVAELLLLHYARTAGFRRVIFRPHNVYGPDMGFEHVIPQLVAKIAAASDGFRRSSARIELQGDGSQTRAFCHIDDAVSGILLCAANGADQDIFHLGTDRETSIGDLARRIGMLCGVEVALEPGPEAPGGTARRCPDIGRLRRIGYEPRVGLDAGLAATVDWYREHFRRVRAG